MPSTPETSLRALLRPQSIAVIGVSRDAGHQQTMSGSTILQSLVRFGYPGRIDIVHPSGDEIGGRRSSVSIAALPQAPDAIVLALPSAAAPQAIADAGARGIRGAVVLSAGFSELANEEGTRLARKLQTAADDHGVRICGPNGLGYVNVWDKVLAGYFPSLLSSALPRPGGLSIVTQSGAVGNSLLARAMERGIGTSFVISSGNETNVSLPDYIDFLVNDPQTKVLALYLEGVVDGARLVEALRRCTDRGKPVVVYKVGKSASGAKAAMSHTAKVAGEPALYRGMFRQLGVIEAQHLDELIEIPMLLLKTSHCTGRPPVGIGVVSISGGLGAVVADHFAAEGFALPTLSEQVQRRLAELPVKLGSTANPVDTTAAIQRTEATLKDILAIVADDPQIDAVVFPNAARFPAAALNVAGIMADAAQSIAKPVLSIWYAGADNQAAIARLHESERVACFDDPAACARAMGAFRDFRLSTAAPTVSTVQAPAQARDRAGTALALRGTLDEAASKEILRAYDVPIPNESLARSAQDAAAAADAIGFPVAMKIVSRDIPHKARVGGVRLNLSSRAAVLQAHAAMLDSVATRAPGAHIEGVLVTQMVGVRLELLVGGYRDSQFGPVLVVGMGGADVESLPDVAMRLLPVTAADCKEALESLQDRRVRLLTAHEKAALAEVVERVAAMAWDLRDELCEIDVNPVALTFEGRALALDALIKLTRN